MLMIDDDVLLRKVSALLLLVRMGGGEVMGGGGRGAAERAQVGGRVVVGDVGRLVVGVVLTDDGRVLLLRTRLLSFV